MTRPPYCPNPTCRNYLSPAPRWYYHNGSYHTTAHGRVARYRCKACGTSAGAQTYSIHYYMKRRLPLRQVFMRLRGGASMRDIAREHQVSCTAITTAVFRLARQAMAAQATLTRGWCFPRGVSFDGLVSILTSHDFPVHLNVAVDTQAQFLIAMTHAVVRRGGRPRAAQQRRREAKERVWRPAPGSLRASIALLVAELSRFYHGWAQRLPWLLATDEHPLYRSVVRGDLAWGFFAAQQLAHHVRVAGSAPRTASNPLFSVNYLDMLLRHRMKEHARQTIGFARHAVHQMHRAWIFAYDHNYLQPARVKAGDRSACRAELVGIPPVAIRATRRQFFSRRIDLRGCRMAHSTTLVWRGELASPPLRWKQGQRAGRRVRVPRFAMRDLLAAQQFQ